MTHARAVVLLLLLALVGAGCTGLPDSGPVVDAAARSSVDDARAPDITVAAPTPGMTASAVVEGFLKAMTASPIRVDVARQYLSTSAATEWEPEAATITYDSAQSPRDEGLRVTVELGDAERLGRSGAYLGRLSEAQSVLRFDLDLDGGEYRISNPPDALVVPRDWFVQRFRPASLYYFDPTGRILVPEPVFVPRGEQLASSLVAGLLQGPGRELSRVVRSYVPPGLDPGLSVPVSVDGVARIDLEGGPEVVGPGGERLLAQLAWTLRQDPGISALRVTLGGQVVRGPDGGELYPVEESDPFDPNGPSPSQDLYAVRDRRLHTRDGNVLEPVPGPLGSGETPLLVATANLDGTRAAGVGLRGESLLVADLAVAPDDPGTPPVTVALRGQDLLPPVWDFADRVWVVDRTTDGAVVHVVVDGVTRVIDVEGVSGRDVRSFLVSRDGTRVVAVVSGPESDQVLVGRVQVDDRGALDRVGSSLPLDVRSGLPLSIDDVAWTSPTSLALLTPVGGAEIYEVRTVGVDGSPNTSELLQTPVTGPVSGLAGSPVAGLPTYVVTPTSIIDLTDARSFGFVGNPATYIAYAG